MTKVLHSTIVIGILLLCGSLTLNAQYTGKKVKSKHQVYTDSLKAIDYDRMLPILGAKAYKQGFDIPYPVGLMGNFIWMTQGITIDNMRLGLTTKNTDIPLTEIDFIEFGDNKNTSFSTTFRPDIWLLPFINVYGLFGAGRTSTEVQLVAPINMRSVVDQKITTSGFGIMAAGGVGPVWISIDANFTWNKPELLEEATQVNVIGVRVGHTFVFKNKPERNISIWIGAMRIHMNSQTVGSIAMKDALPTETWERKDKIVNDYWTWYDGLDPSRPVDAKKIAIADEVLTPIIDRIDEADGDAVIKYGMNKQTKELWNGSLGGQFQLNKSWQLRSEVGFIGDRKSVLLSLNYRLLGLRKK